MWDVHRQQDHVFQTIEWIKRAEDANTGLDEAIDALLRLPSKPEPAGARTVALRTIESRRPLEGADLDVFTGRERSVWEAHDEAIEAARDALARGEPPPDGVADQARGARAVLRGAVSRVREDVTEDARKIGRKRMQVFGLIFALLVGGGVLLVLFARAIRRASILEELSSEATALSDSLRMEIHEFRDAMRVLEISEKRYRGVVEAQTEHVIRFHPNGELQFVNEAFARYWDRKPEDCLGDCFLEMLPEQERDRLRDHLDSFTTDVPVKHYELRVVRADGSEAWQSWTNRALYDDDELTEFQSVGRDITKRHEAEAALRRSERHLRLLAGQIQSAREDERKAIARELHDELGQSLTRLRFEIVLAGKACLDERLHERFDGMLELVDSTIAGVRRAASRLRPPLLDRMGVAAAVDWQAREFAAQYDMALVRDIDHDLVADDEASTAIFRVTQEALTNVSRHSDATLVTIRLYADGDDTVLEVEDNGKGIASGSGDARSSGLIGMRERATALAGTVTFGPPPSGKGTRVTFRVPADGENSS